MNDDTISSSVQRHVERNALLLSRFAEWGVGPGDPVNAEFHFFAGNRANAALLARELYSIGHMVLLLRPAADGSSEWAVESGARVSLTEATSESLTRELVELADRFSGRYDGWGASIPRRPASSPDGP